jgi:membrane protease YdiL (CAAX protease family)
MWAVTVMQVPLWLGFTGTVVFAVRRRGSGSLRADVGLELRPADVPLGIVLGVAAQFVLTYAVMWPVLRLLDRSFDEYSEPARELADKAQASSAAGVVLFVVLAVVMAPFVEELFYRGLVHRSAVRLLGVPGGVALTALVFGVSHVQALQLLPLVAFGVVLSMLAQRTGRLGPGIVTHAAFNATTVVLLLLDDHPADAIQLIARFIHAVW